MIIVPIIALLLIGLVVYEHRKPRVNIDLLPSANGARGVALALGRFEARRLLRAPAIWLGVGLTALGVLVISGSDWAMLWVDSSYFSLLLFPFCGMVIIAVNLAVLRSARDGTEEIYAATPASREARTAAHLISGVTPFVIAVVMLGAALASVYSRGAIGAPVFGDLVTGLALVACAVAVGVTSARLIPSAASGVIAVVLMGVLQGAVSYFAGQLARPSWFAPWIGQPDFFPQGLWPRRSWSHLVYLLGLGAFAAALSFLRLRVNRRSIAVLLAALIVIAAGGLVQSRPIPDATFAAIAGEIVHPAPACTTRGNVTYCTHAKLTSLVEEWARPVTSVLAASPSDAASRPLRISQRYSPSSLLKLPARVERLLPPTVPTDDGSVWPPDGAIHPGMSWCGAQGSCDLGLGIQTAAWVVGLPLDPDASRTNADDPFGDKVLGTYDSSGQARAVVALWLGARSTPRARATFERRLTRSVHSEEVADPNTASVPWVCEGITEPGTAYSLTDAFYARQLLRVNDEQVKRTLHARWDVFTDARTPTSELARAFGLRAPAPEDLRAGLEFC